MEEIFVTSFEKDSEDMEDSPNDGVAVVCFGGSPAES
jgi:hypothetical protein